MRVWESRLAYVRCWFSLGRNACVPSLLERFFPSAGTGEFPSPPVRQPSVRGRAGSGNGSSLSLRAPSFLFVTAPFCSLTGAARCRIFCSQRASPQLHMRVRAGRGGIADLLFPFSLFFFLFCSLAFCRSFLGRNSRCSSTPSLPRTEKWFLGLVSISRSCLEH